MHLLDYVDLRILKVTLVALLIGSISTVGLTLARDDGRVHTLGEAYVAEAAPPQGLGRIVPNVFVERRSPMVAAGADLMVPAPRPPRDPVVAVVEDVEDRVAFGADELLLALPPVSTPAVRSTRTVEPTPQPQASPEPTAPEPAEPAPPTPTTGEPTPPAPRPGTTTDPAPRPPSPQPPAPVTPEPVTPEPVTPEPVTPEPPPPSPEPAPEPTPPVRPDPPGPTGPPDPTGPPESPNPKPPKPPKPDPAPRPDPGPIPTRPEPSGSTEVLAKDGKGRGPCDAPGQRKDRDGRGPGVGWAAQCD